MPDWKAFRHQFPLLDRYIYLNACSLGPLPRRGRAALERYANDWDTKGTPVWYSDWLPLLERLRTRVGALLNAPRGSTAIAPSVSVALTTLASGLPLPPGRNKVLIGELDFPTIGHQWLSRPEFEVEFVPSADGMTIPPEAFAERIDRRTALVATTHLFYTTGYLQDVRAIADAAHTAGALCLIDGYQTCGCVPIDVDAMGGDAFVGGCLKWLSGGPGTAFLYVRPELIPDVRPHGTGWFATRDPFSFTLSELDFADDARRLETGTWAMACHYAGLAGLELILEVGVEHIQERRRDAYLISAVAPASFNLATAFSASALLTFSSTGFGAASTRSLASFRPSWVSSRTALITLILLSPTAARLTVNSVFSSSAAPSAEPPAAGAAATAATGAAALMPNSSSIALTASTTSRIVQSLSASTKSFGVTFVAISTYAASNFDLYAFSTPMSC